MKKCIACSRDGPLAIGTKLCAECHGVWKSLHSFPVPSEGAKHKMKEQVGQHVFFKLTVLRSSQIAAIRVASASSGTLVGVA